MSTAVRIDAPGHYSGPTARSTGPPHDRPPLRVVVAEDHTLVREGLVRLLELGGCTVVAVAGSADELLGRARADRPDVVVTDVRMPSELDEDGLHAVLRLRRTLPEIGVVVLSQYLEDEFALALVGDRAAGVGYLLKEKMVDPGFLVDAVRRVASGGSVLDPDVIARLVRRRRVDGPLERLTPRERDVIALMAEGRSNAGIAETLCVTVPAVERHVTGIFAKLGLQRSTPDQHRRVLAVLIYLRGSPMSPVRGQGCTP